MAVTVPGADREQLPVRCPPLGHLFSQLCPRTQSHNLPPLLAIANILEFMGQCSGRRPGGTTFKQLRSTTSHKGAFTRAMSQSSHLMELSQTQIQKKDLKSLLLPKKRWSQSLAKLHRHHQLCTKMILFIYFTVNRKYSLFNS